LATSRPIGAAHVDKLLTIRGTIVRAGTVKLLEARRIYECARCKHRFVVAADIEQGATVQLPTACPSQKITPCKGISFRRCEEISLYTNYQEIQVREGRQCITVGLTPRTLTVVLQDELDVTSVKLSRSVGGRYKTAGSYLPWNAMRRRISTASDCSLCSRR
jgi:DNA helicase MCM9